MSHRYEMYSMGNIVNNYVIALYGDMVTKLIVMIILKCIEISNHYVVKQELTQCYKPIILQKQTNS